MPVRLLFPLYERSLPGRKKRPVPERPKKEVTLNERLITTLGKGYFRSILISNILVTSLSVV